MALLRGQPYQLTGCLSLACNRSLQVSRLVHSAVNGLVVLADVVRSRQIEHRNAFHTELTTALDTVNTRYEGQLTADFKILKGIDEFGGVLDSLRSVYPILVTVLDSVRPQRIRFALARGSITSDEDERSIARMDGDAFHRAADLLSTIESEGLWFDMEISQSGIGRAIADEINLLLELRYRTTDREFQTIRAYEETGTQTAAADRLDVTQQTVSDTLERSGWKLAQRVEQRLDARIEQL
ncbi:hypothetical protein BRC71_05860 [Halobacteriales archaeon QH_7_65_31]|nr:MAG: hypothetical protein BRC71_05860 [Halobacteriales archaeon QH_7_65_31]